MTSNKRNEERNKAMTTHRSQSLTSPEGSTSRIKEEIAIGIVPGEIKPQKACTNCRRSKVKCEHEGQPPCQRCKITKQECKFRLRADDESWRERTDETLAKLADAVDTLVRRGSVPTTSRDNIGASSSSHQVIQSRNQSTPGLYMNVPPSPGNARYMPTPSRPALQTLRPALPARSPYPEVNHQSPLNNEVSGPMDMLSPSSKSSRKREAPSQWNDEQSAALNGSNFRSPSSSSGPQRPRLNSMTMMPPPLPTAHLDQDQIMPSPTLTHIAYNSTSLYLHGYPVGARWLEGNTTSYARATLTIGRDDPRMNAISIGLVTMHRARLMLQFFADKLQPHSYGFPTYPANEQMTPLIISSILMVASLHDPYSRHSHAALKQDCLASIKPEQEVTASFPLDPELGIGVEEITGACIASIWLGGETGWRISRVARWWAIAYLRLFEESRARRNVTLGECLTILPPFRQIPLVDKLRIWLAAYVAEAQQSFILDRQSIVPSQDPSPYIEELLNASKDTNTSSVESSPNDRRGSTAGGSGGSGGSIKQPTAPDRQLMGHAGLLHILLGAQRVQREARWAAEAITAREVNEGRAVYSPQRSHLSADVSVNMMAVRECVDRVVASWDEWMSETEKWKAHMSILEDLSSSTASAMDLTLTYFLTKAHLASLALEPEFDVSSSIAKAASQDVNLLQAQSKIVNMAKNNALSAMQLASSQVGFRERLVYLPGYYHFLLGHSAGFLLLLIQRKNRFLLAGEATDILEAVDRFCTIYVADIATHNFHPNATTSPHPALATAEALSRSCQHLRAQARGT